MSKDKRAVDFVELMQSLPRNNTGCWLWQKAKNAKGYGITSKGLAHRLSYSLFVGEVPSGLCVLHSCDVRNCVNPEHLWIGTQQDNVADAKAKGRMRGPTNRNGEKHPMAQLTEHDVQAVRAIAGLVTQQRIAKQFGVRRETIGKIIRGERWKTA